jgi:Suppressor of fused protein (SUFU)
MIDRIYRIYRLIMGRNRDPIHPMMTRHCEEVTSHYVTVWGNQPTVKRWQIGPTAELPDGFCVLEFPPTKTRPMWAYATCCMSHHGDTDRLELHLFSPVQYEPHVELLTVICHYHQTGSSLGLGHTVNFGRPWMDGSTCDHGLISLPYVDGPKLEHWGSTTAGTYVRFLWILPITNAEREYKKAFGVEALESKFDEPPVEFLNPVRQSVV